MSGPLRQRHRLVRGAASLERFGHEPSPLVSVVVGVILVSGNESDSRWHPTGVDGGDAGEGSAIVDVALAFGSTTTIAILNIVVVQYCAHGTE